MRIINSNEMDILKKILFSGTAQTIADAFPIRAFLLGGLFLNRLHTDADHLDANSIGMNMFFTLAVSSFSPIFSTAAITAPLFGKLSDPEISQEDKEIIAQNIASHFRNSLLYSVFFVGALTSLPLIFSRSILMSLSQDEKIAQDVQTFLRPFALYGMMTAISLASIQLIVANCKPHLLYSNTFILLAGLALTDALCFGKYGFPKMNETGIAIGYTISAIAETITNLSFLFFHRDFQLLQLRKNLLQPFQNIRSEIKEWLKASAALVIPISTELLISFALNTYSSRFGIATQAAFGVCLQWIQLSLFVLVNFGVATMSLFGAELGRIKQVETRTGVPQSTDYLFKIARMSPATTLSVAAPLAISFALIPEKISVLLGNSDTTILKQLSKMAAIVAAGIYAEGANFTLTFQSRVMNDFARPAIGRTIAEALGFAVCILLSSAFAVRDESIAVGYTVGPLLSLVVLMLIWEDNLKQLINPAATTPENKNCIGRLTDNAAALFHTAKQAISNNLEKAPTETREMHVMQSVV